MTRRFTVLASVYLLAIAAGPARGQDPERWFQVEMTIFSNESSMDREREVWSADAQELSYPAGMVRLRRLREWLLLEPVAAADDAETGADSGGVGAGGAVEAAGVLDNGTGGNTGEPLDAPGVVGDADAANGPDFAAAITITESALARLRETGPFPPRETGDFRLPDLQRDAFLALPESNSDFRQSNQALARAGQYRLLHSVVWRQPVVDADSATPIYIAGGEQYGDLRELQGSVMLNFTANRGRVVFSADLWLAEFGGGGDENEGEWTLPPLPEEVTASEFRERANVPGLPSAAFADATSGAGQNTAAIRRIYAMRQQRELRSGEFHYLDHPAFGILVQITPYEPPPPFEFVNDLP